MRAEEYAYIMRRELPITDPHRVKKQMEQTIQKKKCEHPFGVGGWCQSEVQCDLLHPEMLCQGTRGAGKHKSMEMALVGICNEVGLVAEGRATIPGEMQHPDITIYFMGESPVMVDVTNVYSERSKGAEKAMKDM